MPRPRAAECPPATQGRVCTTDAAAFGSKRALGAAVKNLQATSLSMDLVQRPRADGGVPGALGVLRDALSLGPLRLRFEFESWAPLQASRDGPAEASRRVSRTTARVLEGYLARGCGDRSEHESST